jgi:hypothetical protein
VLSALKSVQRQLRVATFVGNAIAGNAIKRASLCCVVDVAFGGHLQLQRRVVCEVVVFGEGVERGEGGLRAQVL